MNQTIKKRIEEIKQGKVPEGYKLTKSGVLPFSWDSLELGKLVSPIQEKAHNNKFEVLSITAGIGFVNQTDKFGMVIAGAQYQNYIVLRKGDFSYNKGNSKTYPQGCIYMLEDRDEAAVPSVFISFRFKPEIHTYYYKHLFINGFLNRQLYRYINAGVRNDGLLNLYNDDFYGCEIPVPSLPEQHKIAKILSTWDKAIELKEKLIEEKKRQRKWLLENLLNPESGVRLPGFEGEWENNKMDSRGTFAKGSGISNIDCENGTEPCVKYGDIYVHYNIQFEKTVSHTSKTVLEKCPLVTKGTLLFTGSGEDTKEIGKCVVYMGNKPIGIGGDIIIMYPKTDVPLFLAYQQNTNDLIRQKAKLSQGNSIVHIYSEQIKSLRIKVPPTIEEQTAIANILSTADKEIDLLEQELEQLQKQKKALMQLLLTGIVRVNYNST